MRSRRRFYEKIVDVTPAPVLAGLETAHQRVFSRVKMLRCVLTPRLVATSDVTARQAHPEMYPVHPNFQAFLASIGRSWIYIQNLIKV